MKIKCIILLIALILLNSNLVFPQILIQQKALNGNNIQAWFRTTGIFNKDLRFNNYPGFEWPKGSNKFAFYSAGLSIGCKINGQCAQSTAFYKGEFAPGFIEGGIPYTNSNFKIYSIRKGDNAVNNPDYANWHLMIPYGAPFIDVNNNNQYDPGIDSVGIRYAAQVLFLCMTDGFPGSHSPNEGFGGGVTNPLLFSQIAWTAWCYDVGGLENMQFIKWVVINKGLYNWDSTFFAIVGDPNLGNADDDYIGCDTILKMGFCYNGDNYDPVYGINPPAVGIVIHKSPRGLTSFTFFTNPSAAPPLCESDPNGEPYSAYLNMQGFKKDSTAFVNPLQPTSGNCYKKVKFVYPGNPESNTGWTEFKGSLRNCGRDSCGTPITVNAPFDRRFILGSGAYNLTVHPNDTVTFLISQLTSRGSSNVNSVTVLKAYAQIAWYVYNSNFSSVGTKQLTKIIPDKFELKQNYPNPFNPITKIKFNLPKSGLVLLNVHDVIGRKLVTLVNEYLPPGSYEIEWNASDYPSGVYFCEFSVLDFHQTKRMVLIK